MDDNREIPAPTARRVNIYDVRWRTYAVRMAIELAIIFAGVYFASAAAENQKKGEQENRRHQIRQALIREIETITSNTRRAASAVSQMLLQHDSLMKSGKFPPLNAYMYLEPIRVENHMWNATLQSVALDLFDVPTVYALSAFYNELNEGFATLQQLRDLSERMLLPVAGSPPSEYYDPSTGRIRAKYRWYFTQQQRLARVARQITEMGDSLLEQLRQQEGILAPADTGPANDVSQRN